MTIRTPPVFVLLIWPDKAMVIREKLSISTATVMPASAGIHRGLGIVPPISTEQLLGVRATVGARAILL